MSESKMREVFEKMTGRFHIPAVQLLKDEDGEYTDKETASYWVVFGIAWAESREAVVIDLSDLSNCFSPDDCGDWAIWLDDVKKLIVAAGLKVSQ